MKIFGKILVSVLCVILVVSTLSISVFGQDGTKDNDVIQFNGHSYKVYIDPNIGWHEAEMFCENLGGHLATITSVNEDTFVYSLVSGDDVSYWLGATDEENEGEWKWVTDETWDYSNASFDNRRGLQHYLTINYHNGRAWDDQSEKDTSDNGFLCDTGGFICEWDYATDSANEVEMFQNYLETDLIPQYGVFDATQTGTISYSDITKKWFDPNGILSASIFDYDSDDSKELLVIYTQEYDYGYKINMDLYEIKNNQVLLADTHVFSSFNPRTPYPNIELNENLGHQIDINMSIVEVDNEVFIVCETYINGSAVYEGTAPDFWILNYNGQEIQYTASLTKTAGGTSDFEYTIYAFDNGSLKEATRQIYSNFDILLTEFFSGYNIKLDLSSSQHSILSEENKTTPIFKFSNKMVDEDWDSNSFTFESTLSVGKYDCISNTTQNPNNDMIIAVFTTEKSLSVETNESMWLAFGLMENGELNGAWEKMSITVSDPTVIELSEYEETEYGYSLEVIGKKQGTTNITITDTKSGANTSLVVSVYDNYTKSYSYNINDISATNDSLSTNIYDLNGLYVSNYNCVSNGSYYCVSMDVYNTKYHTASIDVYDEHDKWIASYPIEKYSDMSSLWDTGEQAFYIVSDCINNTLLTYKQASFSKHTPISNIKVPEGGYFVISNNFAQSPGTFFYNASEILFEATVTWIEAMVALDVNGDLDKSEFVEMLMGEVLEDPDKRDAWMEIFNTTLLKELETFSKKLLTGEASDAYSNFVDDFEDVLNSLDIEWKHLFQNATGVVESAFTKFAGSAGVALEACFAFTSYGNKIIRAIHIAKSIDEPYATVFSSIEEGFINPQGIIINTCGNMDAEAVLQVFKVSNSDTLEVILDNNNPLEKYELYNISFVKNDKTVQPSGNVNVYIPIPADMEGNTCKIYRQEYDGSWTVLDAHIEGNYLVFETEHFSLYAIVGNTAEMLIRSLPSKLRYFVGDTLNSKGLTFEINNQLITTGYICEPTVLSLLGEQKITVLYGSSTAVFYVHVVCSDGEHNPKSGYQKNETDHWKICSNCHIEMDKAKHNFGNWINVSDTNHKRTCECGEYKSEDHVFGDWIITKEATKTQKGSKTATCVCGKTITEEIPTLGNNAENSDGFVSESSGNGDTLGTGVVIGIIVASVAIVVSAGFAIFWFVFKKKRV